MNSTGKMIIVFVLLAAVVSVLALKSREANHSTPATTPKAVATIPQKAPEPAPPARESAAPVKPVKPTKPVTTPDTRLAKQTETTAPVVSPSKTKPVSVKPKMLPRLLELGADKCMPCRMMQPVLEELRKEYAGKLQVDFIDVWKNPAVADQYGIQSIPTQIFFDADGKEIYRHLGFFPKDEIIAKFAQLGSPL